MKYFWLILTLVFASAWAIAQTVSPSPLAFQPPPPTLGNWIHDHLGLIGTASGIISEIVLHIVGIQKDKELSWLYAVEALLKWISSLFGALGDGIHAVIVAVSGSGTPPTAPPSSGTSTPAA